MKTVVKEYHKDVIGIVLVLILTLALLSGCSLSQEEFVAALDAGVSEIEVEELRPIFDEQDNVIAMEVIPSEGID
jgi:hypothetical protein